MIQKGHPTLYEFIAALQREERYTKARRQLISFGDPPARKKRKYVRNSQRILNLVQRYEELVATEDEDGDPRESGYPIYLRTLGHDARGLIDI